MAYPRKGTVTLAQAKSLLSADPLFNTLSSSEKTVFINLAVQKVCSLRNQENKEDYTTYMAEADTIDISVTQIQKGTTAERVAYGLLLNINSKTIWIDTTENTVYGWNGTEWI